MAKSRIAFATSFVVAIAAAACGSIADLDLKYDSVSVSIDGGDGGAGGGGDSSIVDGGLIIRDSSFVQPDTGPLPPVEPSDAGPCESDSDDGGGCDFAQGLGCCLKQGGASLCIFQWEIAAKCSGGLFVGCRGDDPYSESACCWRDGPPDSGARMAVLGASCNEGPHACNTDAGRGCATGSCTESTCSLTAGSFTVGSCGAPEDCP
jgi:hypothetical protein